MDVEAPSLLVDDAEEDQLLLVRSRRPVVAGVAAAIWSLLVGVGVVTCLVMVAWALAPNATGDAAAAWSASGLTWLGAHQVPLVIGSARVTLLPLGALALGLLLTRRGGRWAGRLLARPSGHEVVTIVGSGAGTYALGGAMVAWLSARHGAEASPLVAMGVTGLVAAVGLTWGISGEAGLVTGLRARISDATWRTLLAGVAGVVALFAAGSALVTLSLLRHVVDVLQILVEIDAGLMGTLFLTLLCVLALPTMSIWAMALMVGPGFQVGAAGDLSAFGGQAESLPVLPILAALPTSVPAWLPVLLLLPVAVGVLAGRIRWGRDLPTFTGAALGAIGVGLVVLVLVAGLGFLASGSVGALVGVGPQPLPVAACAAMLVVLGFILDAAAQSLLLTWELYRAEQRAVGGAVAGQDPTGRD